MYTHYGRVGAIPT